MSGGEIVCQAPARGSSEGNGDRFRVLWPSGPFSRASESFGGFEVGRSFLGLYNVKNSHTGRLLRIDIRYKYAHWEEMGELSERKREVLSI